MTSRITQCTNCPALTVSPWSESLFRCAEGEPYILSALQTILREALSGTNSIQIPCGKYDKIVITQKGVRDGHGFWPMAYNPEEVVLCTFRSRLK